ncbi:hypothetical protein N7523_010602 [Penicillium sp. IBT 18751x]|nr:hypothetical protein N7523_010602 [Penicillium sp. IBT 18751x]
MNDFNNYNSQWVSFHIRDHLKDEVSVHHTVIEGGEFYNPENRRMSLTEEEVDEIKISGGGVGEIGAQSRRGSEGRLDLFRGDDKICELHWENRGGEHANLVETIDENDKYRVVHGGWSPEAGPLGHVYVDITEREKKAKE